MGSLEEGNHEKECKSIDMVFAGVPIKNINNTGNY